MVTKESFLKLASKFVVVDVVGHEQVRIKELSCGEFRNFINAESPDDQYGRLLVASIVDEAGELVFGPDDVGVVDKLPYSVVRPIWNAALTLNKLNAKDDEDLEKNS